MDQGLVIVPAGAGAGKTHRIKTQLSDWVKRGVVRPERILAVTFTEAAAGELRERIRAGLLADGLVSEAMAVERAYVSTIHGLGLRLLTEHALAAGASPQPRHLGDAERDLLIRQALAHAKSLDPIKAEPERFGYEANWQKGATVEDNLRGRVLSMIDLLRGLGDKGRDPGLIAQALSRLDEVYGEVLTDPTSAGAALTAAVLAMVAAFPEGGMATVTATPKARVRRLRRTLFFSAACPVIQGCSAGTGASGKACADCSPRTAARKHPTAMTIWRPPSSRQLMSCTPIPVRLRMRSCICRV